MSSFKIERISEDIKRSFNNILLEIKDPRVNSTLISVLRLDLTNDLSYATIYISSLDGIDSAKIAVEGLNSAKGYIKKEMSKRLEIRKIPELIFKASDSIEFSSNLEKMIRDINKGE